MRCKWCNIWSRAIGGAINFVTDINYQNSISFSGSNSRTNLKWKLFLHYRKWHHNLQAGSTQIEELSAQNSSTDLDGTKNLTFNYNSIKFLDDNSKLSLTGYVRKTDSGYDSWDDANANADNILYALQSSIEKQPELSDKITAHIHVHDRYYDTAVKNKYYSQSYLIKGERKLKLSERVSLGFGTTIIKGNFQVKGGWGSSAKDISII